MPAATRSATFQPSNEVERWIESFGVTWEYVPDLPVEQIDKKSSLSNQARRDPRDNETVRVYAEAMKAGAVFPPLVGYRKPNGDVVWLDGNHRSEAAVLRHLPTVACYLVNTSDQMLLTDMLASANATLNGKEAAKQDRLYHAMRLVDAGYPKRHAGRMAGVAEATLHNFVNHQQVIRHADKLGVGRVAKQLPSKYAGPLSNSIDKLPPTEWKALLSAASHATNAQDFRDLVRTVVAANGAGLDVVEQFVHERTAINSPKSAGPKRTQSPVHSFLMHAAAIAKQSPEEVIASCAPEDLDRLRRVAEDIRYIATKVATPQ